MSEPFTLAETFGILNQLPNFKYTVLDLRGVDYISIAVSDLSLFKEATTLSVNYLSSVYRRVYNWHLSDMLLQAKVYDRSYIPPKFLDVVFATRRMSEAGFYIPDKDRAFWLALSIQCSELPCTHWTSNIIFDYVKEKIGS